ncbi:MAG: trypsin-like peptidase domain-containing protein [Hydrogenoanaerobacterium sp.]
MPEENEQSFVTPQPKKRPSGLAAFGVALLCVACVCVLGFAVLGVFSVVSGRAVLAPKSSAGQVSQPVPEELPPYEGLKLNDKPQAAGDAAPQGAFTTEQAIEKAMPSVVTVKVSATMQGMTMEGIGSGVIFEKEGYIITNAHVVEYASGVRVVLNGSKKEYAAKVIGLDTRTDIAVIKIDAEKEELTLVPAEMGNSDKVKLGEKVIIIGTPQELNLAGTATQGIISGLKREINVGEIHYTDLLQLDAAISPGNSGGALINANGQVIGISSTKYIATGVEGLGFAISINSAKPIIDELRTAGKIKSRVCLGCVSHEVTEDLSRRKRMPVGIYVESFKAGSNMPLSGVLAGDVITQINTTPTATFNDVLLAIKGKKAGETVRLKINRYDTVNNKNKELELTVALIQDIEQPSPYEFFKELFPEDWNTPESEGEPPPPKTERLSKKSSALL